jgi:hypothetical protein
MLKYIKAQDLRVGHWIVDDIHVHQIREVTVGINHVAIRIPTCVDSPIREFPLHREVLTEQPADPGPWSWAEVAEPWPLRHESGFCCAHCRAGCAACPAKTPPPLGATSNRRVSYEWRDSAKPCRALLTNGAEILQKGPWSDHGLAATEALASVLGHEIYP